MSYIPAEGEALASEHCDAVNPASVTPQISVHAGADGGVLTLVLALYFAVFAPGVRAAQSVDAMAVIYMVTTLVWLLIALRFVNPTQIVARAKQEPSH